MASQIAKYASRLRAWSCKNCDKKVSIRSDFLEVYATHLKCVQQAASVCYHEFAFDLSPAATATADNAINSGTCFKPVGRWRTLRSNIAQNCNLFSLKQFTFIFQRSDIDTTAAAILNYSSSSFHHVQRNRVGHCQRLRDEWLRSSK